MEFVGVRMKGSEMYLKTAPEVLRDVGDDLTRRLLRLAGSMRHRYRRITDEIRATDKLNRADLGIKDMVEKSGETSSPDLQPLTSQPATVGRNTITWEVNAAGRAVHASATLREVFPKAERSGTERKTTTRAGHSSGRHDDHGGHVIGHRFVLGQGEKNVFPEHKELNLSAHKVMENEWQRWVERGAEVRAEVHMYGKGGEPLQWDERPSQVGIDYTIHDSNGKKIYEKQVLFDNEVGQTFDRLPTSEIKARTRRT